MLDYDGEAATYDATRGGPERGRAAAEAVATLVPSGGLCLDVAGGTGVVSAELAALGFDVVVADRSAGMLGFARDRLPGRGVVADAVRLPLADGSVDLVTTVWLLHLLGAEAAGLVITEVARVLRPGGHWVTSVDKAHSHGRHEPGAADDVSVVTRAAALRGMEPVGVATFTGATVWSSPEGRDHQEFRLAAFHRLRQPTRA